MSDGYQGDTLSHNGRQFELMDQPLEAYFELIGQRPVFSQMHDGQFLPRGYRAKWAIDDGWLFLVELTGSWPDGRPVGLHQLFPFAGDKVFAAWYAGKLRGYRKDRPLPELTDQLNVRYPDIVMVVENGRNRMATVMYKMPAQLRRAQSDSPDRSADVIELFHRAPARAHAAWSEAMV